MNKNRILLGFPFMLATIASVLYYSKGHNVGPLFSSILAIFVAGLFGFAFAYGYTNNDGILDDKEKNKAITIGIGFFSGVATLLLFSSLNVADYTAIEYHMVGYTHFFEIVIRMVVGIILGGAFFLGNFALLSWLVPWTGRTFHKKVNELSATPAAATTPTTTAAAAPTTAAAATTTTAAAGTGTAATGATGATTPAATPAVATKKRDVHPMTIVLIIVSILVFLGMIFGGKSPTTPPVTPPVVQPVVTPTPAPTGGTPLKLADETVGAVNHP